MKIDKFLIAPIKSGQQTNVKPWLIMDDAFENLQNAYTWRGTVRKRFGTNLMNESKAAPFDQLFSRFRINIGMTDGAGNFGPAVITPVITFIPGQMFSVDNEVLTVNQLGVPAPLLTTGLSVSTFDTTMGILTIRGSIPNEDIFFYPALPVMGFGSYEVSDVSDELLFGFDTAFAYMFDYNTGWNQVTGGAGNNQWTGSDSDFFWTTNYRGADSSDFLLFITNNIIADGFRYWDGANFTQLGTAATTPFDTVPNFIVTAKIIVPFKNRLILMNVTENVGGQNINIANRIRWSQNGSPVSADAWLQFPVTGKGGFLEAPTKQAIISCAFMKDRLIVFFELSTWELVYTGNTALPFTFQKLNDELGVESSNSIIGFDRSALGFGSTGIHSCNGLNVQRVDGAIPDTIFEVSNDSNGPQRVAGIRDYFTEVAYWAYNSIDAQTSFNDVYPNRVLVFDYVNKTWAYNDDSFTAFGLFFLQQDFTWDDLDVTWQNSQITWKDGSIQNKFRSVITGNQQGWTSVVNRDESTNCFSLYITNIVVAGNIVTITCIDHNLADDSYIFIDNIVSDDNMGAPGVINGLIWQVTATSYTTFTIDVGIVAVRGNYLGGGTISRVSQIVIDTKQYNFYATVGAIISLNKVSFFVDRTTTGQIMVTDYSSSSSQTNEGYVLETTPYANIAYEVDQDKFWHNLYFNSYGETVQLRLSLSQAQMMSTDAAFADFQLNAMLFNTSQANNF